MPNFFRVLVHVLPIAALGALLIALVSQIPVRHPVDIGGIDAAYVQGFHDPERTGSPDLSGSDGSARWTRTVSYLLFPQAGLPAEVVLRMRGPDAAPVDVRILQNDTDELARLTLDSAWRDVRVPVRGGLFKPEDVVIAVRVAAAPRSPDDSRPVGVLLDRAAYSVGPAPILPYPAQLLWGAVFAGLLHALGFRRRQLVVAFVLMMVVYLLFYRMQPIYPFPLRGLLPGSCAVLAAILVIRHGPRVLHRLPLLPDIAALAGIVLWSAVLLGYTQQHVTLALPGVEADFRVFALRSERLGGVFQADGDYSAAEDGVLRADGFYNLGYPFLLWLLRPLTADNPFLAARLLGILSGGLFLLAGWFLARTLFGRVPAMLVVGLLGLNAFTVQYALSLGTDMPFAALCTLALALLLRPAPRRRWIIAAGMIAGAAFLLRHPGILLLPLGWLWQELRTREQSTGVPPREGTVRAQYIAPRRSSLVLFTLAFGLACLPQFVVNLRDTGELLYSQQAKNIWLAVYGNSDWSQWAVVGNTINFIDVLAADPGRFLTNWLNNLRAFIGTGAEDTSEFGRAIQLRVLGFPANWLALAGLLGWLLVRPAPRTENREPGWRRAFAVREGSSDSHMLRSRLLLLIWPALYVASVAVGLGLPRFFLPLVPVYALAAAWLIGIVLPGIIGTRGGIAAVLLLGALLWGNPAIGAGVVLNNQPADEVAVVQLIENLPTGMLIVRAPPRVPIGKYSAIAHRVLPTPADDTPTILRASGARYLIWSDALGPTPETGPVIGRAGEFIVMEIIP